MKVELKKMERSGSILLYINDEVFPSQTKLIIKQEVNDNCFRCNMDFFIPMEKVKNDE